MYLKSSVLSLLLLFCASEAYSQHRGPGCGSGWRPKAKVSTGLPNGTLIFYESETIIGKAAKVITEGDRFTHVAIVIDGLIYEADFPRVKKSSRVGYGKPKSTMYFYAPRKPFTGDSLSRMRAHAERRLGEPYRLYNYFQPHAPRVYGTWCSRYVGDVLNASGRYKISKWVSHEPQDLFGWVKRDYYYMGQYRP